MSNIRVDLDSVEVTDGQGGIEGDFELRLEVKEGNHHVIWPAGVTWAKVDKNGPPHPIGQKVAIYDVSSGTLSKRFNVTATEVDGGTLGGDDYGSGVITFDLTPNMAPSVKSTTISLKRPNMKYEGKVKVTMAAQRV
jgi:hypothetical protein